MTLPKQEPEDPNNQYKTQTKMPGNKRNQEELGTYKVEPVEDWSKGTYK